MYTYELYIWLNFYQKWTYNCCASSHRYNLDTGRDGKSDQWWWVPSKQNITTGTNTYARIYHLFSRLGLVGLVLTPSYENLLLKPTGQFSRTLANMLDRFWRKSLTHRTGKQSVVSWCSTQQDLWLIQVSANWSWQSSQHFHKPAKTSHEALHNAKHEVSESRCHVFFSFGFLVIHSFCWMHEVITL